MKYLFGLLSLVAALASVSWVMKTQRHAVTGDTATPAITVSPSSNAATLAQHSNDLQQQARQRATEAVRQGAQRNARADP